MIHIYLRFFPVTIEYRCEQSLTFYFWCDIQNALCLVGVGGAARGENPCPCPQAAMLMYPHRFTHDTYLTSEKIVMGIHEDDYP